VLVEIYSYTCKRKKVEITHQEMREKTKWEHRRYRLIVCQECCNVPVYHLVYRDWEERDGNSTA